MAVEKIKTEGRCKICRSDFRDDIDILLEKRSKFQHDEDGNRINGQYVMERCVAWGIANINEQNLKMHFRNHCKVVDEADLFAAQQAQLEELERIVQGGDHANVDEVLRTIVSMGLANIKAKAAAGQNPISIDHILKAIDGLTRRSHNEAQHTLLTALVGGVGAALQGAIGPKQIGEGEVIIDQIGEEVVDAESDVEPAGADSGPEDREGEAGEA